MRLPLLASEHGTGWQARLHLEFAEQGGRTALSRRRHIGPLRVQRPFYPDADGTCHVYMLHPPGGMVSGDQTAVEIVARRNSKVLLTTPSANKLYTSKQSGGSCVLSQRIIAEAGSRVEWLPQGTIAFDGSRSSTLTRVSLQDDAMFVGWELLCLGRPACGEQFSRGSLDARFELWRDDVPIYLERQRLQGSDSALQAPWGLQGSPVLATLLLAPGSKSLLDEVRSKLLTQSPRNLSGTQLEGVTVFRYLGDSLHHAQDLLARIWEYSRTVYGAAPVELPRVWKT